MEMVVWLKIDCDIDDSSMKSPMLVNRVRQIRVLQTRRYEFEVLMCQ